MTRLIRTDLALELKEDIERECVKREDGIQGVNIFTKLYDNGNLKETIIKVVDENGAKKLGKPMGTYITLEGKSLRGDDDGIFEPFVKATHRNLKKILGNADRILVIGLGNRAVTPDALGPYVVDNLYVTRHLISEGIVNNVMEISALCPGVMAQTGIETQTIIKSVCKEIKPDVIIAVDALAAREPSRLNSTIQICDTGISPGAGVGNNRAMLNKDTLGVDVIAIGVPTVVSVPSIVNQSIEGMVRALSSNKKGEFTLDFSDEEKYELACELVEEDLASMFVTPKNIDESVKRISFTISESINRLLK